MEIYTAGFTKHTAREFFESLKRANIRQLVDVRLNNSSQLAGFAKRSDLEYFLEVICDARYLHEPRLAPTQELLGAYRAKEISWGEYEERFRSLLQERHVESEIERSLFSDRTVLLCSEHTADHCHRRIVCEYLAAHWGNVTIFHLS